MKTRQFIALASFLAAMCTGGLSIAAEESASHLSAAAELAHYARYHAASGQVRALGAERAGQIESLAKAEHFKIPAAITASDARLVKQLERLEGDDFDLAYLQFTGVMR